jgi:hypothetical protein
MSFSVEKNKLMSFIQYKLTKWYSNVIYKKKRNMDKTIKFPAILLFVFLFSITKVVANIPPFLFTKTSVKCRHVKDCVVGGMKPTVNVFRCLDGYCIEGMVNPEYSL